MCFFFCISFSTIRIHTVVSWDGRGYLTSLRLFSCFYLNTTLHYIIKNWNMVMWPLDCQTYTNKTSVENVNIKHWQEVDVWCEQYMYKSMENDPFIYAKGQMLRWVLWSSERDESKKIWILRTMTMPYFSSIVLLFRSNLLLKRQPNKQASHAISSKKSTAAKRHVHKERNNVELQLIEQMHFFSGFFFAYTSRFIVSIHIVGRQSLMG